MEIQKKKKFIVKFTKKHSVKKVVISVYHFSTNEMIKGGHRVIIDVFAKMHNRRSIDRVRNLRMFLLTNC